MPKSSYTYKRHRFSAEIIPRAVWLYYRYPLNLRLVEEILLERGIVVSYETVRQRGTRGGHKIGPEYARRLWRKQSDSSEVWHLDEVVISINGKKHWLWRAVDQDGYVLDEIVQTLRTTKVAKRLLKRLAKKQGYSVMLALSVDFTMFFPIFHLLRSCWLQSRYICGYISGTNGYLRGRSLNASFWIGVWPGIGSAEIDYMVQTLVDVTKECLK